jgi:Hemerythrin HHE cation binding domain
VDDVVTVLSRQHDELGRLMRAIEREPQIGAGASGRDLRRLQVMIDDLRRCFVIHERSKERYLWPVLRRAWPDGDAIFRAARLHKRHVEERLVKLRWLSERDAYASEVLDEVLAGIQEHISLENHLLGRIRRSLPREILEEVGARLARKQFLVPTRPHPDMPVSPRVAAVLGPVIGLADRLIEAFSFGPSGA